MNVENFLADRECQEKMELLCVVRFSISTVIKKYTIELLTPKRKMWEKDRRGWQYIRIGHR